ncbi:MAG: SDR family oxidoreductase [Sphingomonadales bacterium]|jgi:retinol dehydrogenase-13
MRYDLTDKVALVTGATSGIGWEIAKGLAQLGAQVIVHGRSDAKLSRLLKRLPNTQNSDKHIAVKADFRDLSHVRKMTDQVLSETKKLDILVNNAGVWTPRRQTTKQGYELQFQVNYLAPFLTLQLLKNHLTKGRVVNITSAMHLRGHLDFADLMYEYRPYSGLGAYAQSKLALMMATKSWAEKTPADKFTINAVHPGIVRTKIASGMSWQALVFRAFGLFYLTPREGAVGPLRLAASPKYEGKTGGYYTNHEKTAPHPLVQDKAARERLWTVSKELCSIE